MTDALHDRQILRVTGADAREFLQRLISNDIARADHGLVYAALLTQQGKYLADFFVLRDGDGYLLDVAEALAPALLQRLTMYRLRADVQIAPDDMTVAALAHEAPGAHRDPRDPAMGWRHYGVTGGMSRTEYDALRVTHLVPESGVELVPNESYILEMDFERLRGVDFRKGCYVGQEVTARMKHKTELRKGLARVTVAGDAPVGTPIEANGKDAGVLHTTVGGQGIAFLRFDRAVGDMSAGEATVRRVD